MTTTERETADFSTSQQSLPVCSHPVDAMDCFSHSLQELPKNLDSLHFAPSNVRTRNSAPSHQRFLHNVAAAAPTALALHKTSHGQQTDRAQEMPGMSSSDPEIRHRSVALAPTVSTRSGEDMQMDLMGAIS